MNRIRLIAAALMLLLPVSCDLSFLTDPVIKDPEDTTAGLVKPVVQVDYTALDSLSVDNSGFVAWAYDTTGVYGVFVNSIMEQKCGKNNTALNSVMAEESGSETPSWGYWSYIISYSSTDAAGKEVVLSERIVLPAGFGFKHAPKGIALVSHPTIGADRERPTRDKDILLGLTTLDYVAVFPDLMGFGESRDRVHPYLCADLTARHSVDGVFAALSFLYDRGIALQGGGKLVNVGYSQGGASALAVHRYIENELPGNAREQLNLKASYCGGGPYSLTATWDAYREADLLEYPSLAPMTILAFKEAYPQELKDTDPYDCLCEALKTADYLKLIQSKEYPMYLLNAHLKLAVGSARMSDILSPAMLDRDSGLYAGVRKLMEKNELSSGWSPSKPVYLFHVRNDEVVPYVNYEKAMSGLSGGKVSALKVLFSAAGSHTAGAGVFYMQIMDEL